MQSYLKEAIRNLEIKVFKADIYNIKGEKITYYFTCRLELGYILTKGNCSVYDKLDAVRNILTSTNLNECKEQFE